MLVSNVQIAEMLEVALRDIDNADYWLNKWTETDNDVYYTWSEESECHARGIIDTVNYLIDKHAPTFTLARNWEIRDFCEKHLMV